MEHLFTTEKITDTLTRIVGVTGENMYLAVGKERAALIDTGVGIGSLKAFVETLTDKPVTVILTHGHADHAFGACEFDDVYMSYKDRDIVELHSDIRMRMEYCQMSPLEYVKNLPAEGYLPAPQNYKDLHDGDVFELGGVTLEIYELPGHTKGSMTVLFKEDRLLLTGDACNPGTFMFFRECPSIEEYRDNLVTFKARLEGKYDRILLSHGSEILEPELLDTVTQACHCIMDGTSDNMPMDFMGEEAYCAFEMVFDNGFKRKDGKVGNIMFSKENIFKK